MTKKLLIFSTLLAIVPAAVSAKNVRNITGSTGLFITPSADTLNAKDINAGFTYLSERDTFTTGLTAGVINNLEVGATFATDNVRGIDQTGTVHGKYKFYKGEIDAAGYTHVNFGDGAAAQFLVLLTAGKLSSLKTSLAFGKYFHPGHNGLNFDFSIGAEKTITSSLPWLSWVLDFSNYNPIWNMSGTGAGTRGSFNTGVRAAIKQGKMKFGGDLMLTDFFDDSRGFNGRGIGVAGFFSYQL